MIIHRQSAAMTAEGSRGRAIVRTETVGLPVDASPGLEDVTKLIAERLVANDRPFLVTFVNPGSVTRAENNPSYCTALSRFDLVLPDGIALAKAVERLHHVRAERISFDSTSLALPVLEFSQRHGNPVVLVGGKPGVVERAAEQLRKAFPSLRIAGAFDGYGDVDQKIAEVQTRAPKIVICGMGGNAQEAFLLRLAERGWCGCGFTCGGYLDQLAGGLQYYPAWIDAANLRWAYRLAKEPRRLWRRYLFDYGRFGLRLTQALLRPTQRST